MKDILSKIEVNIFIYFYKTEFSFSLLEYILEKALSFSNQALHIYNPKQVLYEAVNHILDFFDKLPKDPHDATLLVELFNLGALVLKEDIGKLQVNCFLFLKICTLTFHFKREKNFFNILLIINPFQSN